MSNLVKFSYGLLANYEGLATKDQNTVYFITDHNYIYFKGVKYGVENGDIAAVSGVELGADNKTLTISYLNGAEATTIVLAEATETTAGLMSAADKAKLDALKDSADQAQEIEAINEAIDKLNGTAEEEGSVAKAIADSEAATKSAYEAYADQAEADAISAAAADAQAKIEALDVDEITKSGEYIVAVSETDGKISATTKAVEAKEVAVADEAGLIEAANVEGALAELAGEIDTNASNINTINQNITAINQDIEGINGEIDGIDTKIAALEGAVGGENGSVATQISSAITALDAEVGETEVAEGKHVAVQVVEVDGVITEVNVAESDIASAEELGTVSGKVTDLETAVGVLNGAEDETGSVAKAVADAKAELLGDAAADYNTLGKLEDKIQEVAANANTYEIAAVEGDELSALGTNVKEAWKLVDKDGIQAGSTIKIYKDSNLKSVALDGQELKFTYILADGSESEVGVDVSAFLAESEFSDGLQVVDGVVSVALADHVEGTKDNYLVMEEGKLAVREVRTDDTKLQKDIIVAGLSDTFGAGNYENNDVIPAGTDIYTILQNILCKELYPTATSKQGTITAAVGAPTVTTNVTGTVEVGTEFKMTAATCPNSTVSTTNSTVTGMTYGYSAADDDEVENSATSISKSWSTEATGNSYAMSAAVTGFNANSTTATTPAAVSTQSMAETTIGYVAEGSNTLKVNVTGDSFTGSVDGIDSVFLGSNLGNTDAAKKSTAVAALTNEVSNTPSNSKTVTITGVYKYFLGYSTNTAASQFNSASVRALTTKTGNVTKDGTTTIVAASSSLTSNGTSIVIACPKKYKLATIQNGVGANILSNFSSTGTVSVATGAINTDYTVYVYPITNGAAVEFKNVTLTKA